MWWMARTKLQTELSTSLLKLICACVETLKVLTIIKCPLPTNLMILLRACISSCHLLELDKMAEAALVK